MTAPARILVIEDDDLIRTSVVAALRSAGHTVQGARDGAELSNAADFRPDLAIVDVMLPGADGFAVARGLRRARDLSIVFLTARDGVGDRLAGFELGADDYIVKPFVTAELLARVGAILRRLGRMPATIDLGGVLIDEAASEVQVHGATVELTATEFRLLLFFAHHRGRVLSKAQILTQVWGYDDYDQNLVEVHVSALRRKLGVDGLLQTVRGLGYVLRPVDAARAG